MLYLLGVVQIQFKFSTGISTYILFYIVLRKVTIVLLSPQVAKDVISEFAADGVKYLELRSTPREEKTTGKDLKILFCGVEFEIIWNRYVERVATFSGLTKKRYIETVLSAIQQCRNEELDIDVR